MAKIIDPDDLVLDTHLILNTTNKTIELVATGALVAKDGVTGNAIWAKLVDVWCTSAYQPFPFPMNVLDARSGQYILGQDPGGAFNGWKPLDDTTRQMIRDAGWSEYSSGGVLNREYVGMVALSSGFPSLAQFYYQKDSTEAGIDFTFDDGPNEAIQVFGDAANGDFDDRTFFKIFWREEAYLYDDAVLADVGETGTGAYKVSLPVAVGSDLKITDIDALVSKSLTVTGAVWSGGTATYTTATHGLNVGDFVVITGVDPVGYNVRGLVTGIPLTTTFEVAIVSDPGTWNSGGTVKTIYDLIKARYFASAFTRDIESAR